MTRSTRCAAVLVVLTLAVSLAGCTDNATGTADGSSGGDDATVVVEVISTAIGCSLSRTEAPAGAISFDVRNDGTEVTEFYLLAADGETIIGEVENIGPGISRSLSVTVDEPGDYVSACKPGMTGDGIRGTFTVSGGSDDG